MAYNTQQDMIDRYGERELIQLTDRAGAGEIDAVSLGRAIDDATATIDSRLGGRYALPISPVPRILEAIACKLTLLNLYEKARQMTDDLRDDREALLGELDGIGSGRISIGIDDAGGTPDSNNTVEMTSGGNVFNRKDDSFI